MIKGREKEVLQILTANAAVAVGNLLLGKFDSWDQFREPLKLTSCHYQGEILK